MIRLCFVCLGNICRSPTAEGIMLALVAEAGLDGKLEVESAGTGGWHVGEAADPRTQSAAARQGITLRGRAQQFTAKDFARFDHVLALDNKNQRELAAMAPDDAARAKVRLLRSFDPKALPGAGVPDPYYGDQDGFDNVFAICDAACRGLLAELRREHRL